MLADIKLGLKLMKYGFQVKMMAILLVLFYVLGILFELFMSNSALGGLYLGLCGTYLFQLAITPSIGTLVSSSFAKKALQTSVPCTLCAVGTLINYTTYVICKLIRMNKTLGSYEGIAYRDECTLAIVTILIVVVMMVYSSVCYKKFVLGVIILIVFLAPVIFLSSGNLTTVVLNHFIGPDVSFSLTGIIIAGYVVIIATSFVSYLLSLAVYKYEMDPKAYRSAMSRAGR